MGELKHSQKIRILDFLEERRWSGVHSLEVRRAGLSGNASERFRELAADGVLLHKRREKLDGIQGIRVWLAPFAPRNSTLIPYEPGDLELDGGLHPPAANGVAVEPPAAVEPKAARAPIAMAYLYEPGQEIRCLPWATICALTGAHEAVEVTEAEAKRILATETLAVAA